MLEFRLFGIGQAWYHGQPLDGFPNLQCHRLLCYLLLNRRHPHSRERLAAVFWSEYPTSTSRKYLRNSLWKLSKKLQPVGACLDDYLRADDETIGLREDVPLWLDVQAFQAAISSCQELDGQRLQQEQAARLRDAVALYTGDLLEGVYEDWCLYDREQLRLWYLGALSKLLVYCESHTLYERGLEYGKRLLEYAPTRERVHRQMMRLYWALGEPGEALAQYKCCVQILRQELDSPPVEKTRLLYEQMVHNRFDPADWSTAPGLPSPGTQPDASTDALTRHAVRRLEHLQAMAAQSRSELIQVEHLLSQLLAVARSV